jgi:CRP-like cAMP-binding protein
MHIPYDGQNFFLSNLLPADFALLEPHLRSLELRVGDYLHRLADDVEDVVFPHSGVVALTLPLQQRTNQEAALLGREGLVGAFAAAALAPATSNAEVRIHGMATRISAQAFRDALAASPRMRRLAAYCDSALMAQMQHSALCNAAHSADARLCRWLLEIHDRSSDKLRLTQATLGGCSAFAARQSLQRPASYRPWVPSSAAAATSASPTAPCSSDTAADATVICEAS